MVGAIHSGSPTSCVKGVQPGCRDMQAVLLLQMLLPLHLLGLLHHTHRKACRCCRKPKRKLVKKLVKQLAEKIGEDIGEKHYQICKNIVICQFVEGFPSVQRRTVSARYTLTQMLTYAGDSLGGIFLWVVEAFVVCFRDLVKVLQESVMGPSD